MLVLTRKTQQHIQIGEDITVTIVRVKGRTVRVGIEAPDHLPIRRSEKKPRRTPLVPGKNSPKIPKEENRTESSPLSGHVARLKSQVREELVATC